MFNTILIANRGEIACRIMRTARQMGIQTIAVYSTVDEHSLHVQEADKAYCIGAAPAQDSYLNIAAILHAAELSGAEAIHPGYGFLSENPAFARACAEAKRVFIGPSVQAMEAMASKQIAKQLLSNSAVPLVPGYHGQDQTDAILFQEALRIGFPLLLKPASGGGGKGMRVVEQEKDLLSAFAAARREAKASFADETLIIEKLIVQPRHVEVQILADEHGNIVHLFERDCSLQRRHQKIIEEAPAPFISEDLRFKITTAAKEAARTIHYSNAGTVEFLVDKDEQFYFMEMNTRLQVEHPVTEMITGLDLVAWQIKIANHEPLPWTQNDITYQGHAFECRIYAEDPEQQFLPSIGQIRFLRTPQGEGIRLDSGVNEHSTISQYYDPMLAKLITWGETRENALQRMRHALSQMAIGGVKTNIPFLQALCNHPQFKTGHIHTHFLSQEPIVLPPINIHHALLMAASFDYINLITNENDPLFLASFGWAAGMMRSWSWQYWHHETLHTLKITAQNAQHFLVQINNEQEDSIKTWFTKGRLIMEWQQRETSAWVHSEPSSLSIFLPEACIHLRRYTQQSHQGENTLNQLVAPMPATIAAIFKKEGDSIRKGEPLMVLEAMKMEHTIHAPQDGIIKEMFYTIGSQVDEGAELLQLTQVESN